MFSLNKNQFGEDVGENKAQIIHAITSLGFLLSSYRIYSVELKFPKELEHEKGLDSPISVSSSISNVEEEEEVNNQPGFITFTIFILSTFEIYLFSLPFYLYLMKRIIFNFDIIIFSLLLPLFTILIEYSIDYLENPKL